MNPRVQSAEHLSGTLLKLIFNNGECKFFDLGPYLDYPVYQKLKDKNILKQVQVKHGIICWDDEIDFDPDRVYLESALTVE